MQIHLDKGETVEIPVIPSTIDDDDWNTWNISWWYSVD